MPQLIIVSLSGGTHIGGSFLRAAHALGLPAHFADMDEAYRGPAWLRRLNWHLLQRRPAFLRSFSKTVTRLCQEKRPGVLLTTGLAPVSARALDGIGRLGVMRINYLTDDPWNRAHRASWFTDALPRYDLVFSPRRANLPDLQSLGCRAVQYLPFGYDPELFFPPPANEASAEGEADVAFVGGADPDRVPFLEALLEAGFSLALHGGYWQRYPKLRTVARGMADVPKVRQVLASAKVNLCLVRRANRDGNSMRTFEVPAVGGCMLLEDTDEHREIFGPEGEAVLYFRDVAEMIVKARRLCGDGALRKELAAKAHQLITSGKHTYQHRLESMLARGASTRLNQG